MSGQQIGTAVGFVAGFFLPGGPTVWAGIGGMIGGAISPTKIEGPRLTDGMGVTAQDGVPNPWGFGTFSTGVNVINAFDLVEHEHVDDGKGSGMEQTTYTYTRSFALGVCRAVRNSDGTYSDIAGIARVTHNGKDIFNALPDATADQRANNAKFLEQYRIYLGGEGQMPDPTLEAYLGAGNASAYRGQVYIVGTDIDQTDSRGAMGTWEVVVVMQGAVQASMAMAIGQIDTPNQRQALVASTTGSDWEATTDPVAGPIPIAYMCAHRDRFYMWQANEVYVCAPDGSQPVIIGTMSGVGGGHQTYTRTDRLLIPGGLGAGVYVLNESGLSLSNKSGVTSNNIATRQDISVSITIYETVCRVMVGDVWAWGAGGVHGLNSSHAYYISCNDDYFVAGGSDSGSPLKPMLSITANGNNWSPLVLSTSSGTAVSFVIPGPSGVWVALIDNGEIWWTDDDWGTFHRSDDALPQAPSGLAWNGRIFISGFGPNGDGGIWTSETGEHWQPQSQPLARVTALAAHPLNVNSVTPDSVPLADIVEEVCRRSGLTASDIDTSQLPQNTLGFKVATETTGEAIIGSLMPGYFFDVGEWDDRLRFVTRGGDPVFHLTVDDLAERDGPVIEETEVQEVELLRKVIVHAMDPTAGYIETPQEWERRAATVAASGEQTISIPVVMEPDEQKQVAQKRVKVGWTEVRRFAWSLPYTRPELTPTDCGTITDRAGRVQGVRLEQMTEDSGIIEIREAKLYRQSAYVSNAVGISHGQRPTTTPQPVGPTFFWAGNLPSLRTSDNVPGMYIAAAGYQRGWHGASIWLSTDNGASFQRIVEWPRASRMGVLTGDITDSSEPIPVFMNSGTLSTVTDDQLANRANGFAITTAGVSEVGQFKTATLTGAMQYDLTDTVRGGLGTTAAAHATGDPFVMLSSVQFLPIDISHAGKTLIFKAVSYGQNLDETTEYPVVFSPLFTSVTIESYVDEDIEDYVDENGQTYITEVTA